MPTLIPKKSFYFVRHGESEANKLEMMCGGGIDTPLTEFGRHQTKEAQSILDLLDAEKPQVICHSDLSRATETAKLLNQKIGLSSVSTPGLREHFMGDWEGKHWRDVVPKLEKKQDPENGESFFAFHQRINKAITDILNTHTLPLIVAHGGFWHALSALHGHEATEWPVNAKLYFFRAKEKTDGFPWQIRTFKISEKGNALEIDQSHLIVRLKECEVRKK